MPLSIPASIAPILPVAVELYECVTDASGQNKHIRAGKWQKEAKSAKLQIQLLLERKLPKKLCYNYYFNH